MQLESVLCLPALLEAGTWDDFAVTLVSAVRDSFSAKRVFLALPYQDRVAIYAEAVIGQRAFAFAEAQEPAGFFGVEVEALTWQMTEPAISVRPVHYQMNEIWDVPNDESAPLYRLILPLLSNDQTQGLLYVELSDVVLLQTYLDTAAFRIECEALAEMLGERVQAFLFGHDLERDEMTRRLQQNLQRAEEYRELLQKLHQVTLRLTQTTSLDALYRGAVQAAIGDLGIDRLGLFTANLATNEMCGTYGTDNNGDFADEHWYRATTPEHQIFKDALATPGEVIVKEDAAIYYNKVVVGRGWNSLVALYADNTLLGWMAADNFLHRRSLMPYQREVMKLFAAIVSQLIRGKQVQEELRLANERLLQQSDTLAVARDAAEAASHAKSTFLATMSHEIRTPLNGILGFVQLLGNTPLNREQSEYVMNVRKSGDSLVMLVNDLLDFSKIEAGKLQLVQAPFDLVEVIEEACAILASRALEAHLELVIELAPDLPAWYVGDALRLKQVLVNLISNAIKFTEYGGIRVCAALQHGKIEISITDTGIGIGPASLAQLFQRFYQAESGSTRRYGGTGLGLAICKSLLELMDGDIQVSSVLGAGSQFTVILPVNHSRLFKPRERNLSLQGKKIAWLGETAWLARMILPSLHAAGAQIISPLHAAKEPIDIVIDDGGLGAVNSLSNAPARLILDWHHPATLADNEAFLCKVALTETMLLKTLREMLFADKVDAPATVASPLGFVGGRILVAEDNVINQRVIAAFLKKLGCDVTLTSNGADAVLAANNSPFDLVLMDWQMPEMDGLEATRVLRRQPHTRSLPIIALTANAFEHSENECLAAGMDGFLAKPIDFTRLQAMIEQYLLDERVAEVLTQS